MVTGSSKRIGKAIAIEFAKERYKIVLNARDKNELSEAANNIKNTSGANEERITYLAGDVSHEDVCSSLIEHIQSRRLAALMCFSITQVLEAQKIV